VSAVDVRTEPSLPRHPAGARLGRAPGWWGMVLLIFTEATFFAILLTSYFFLRFRAGPVWPPDGIKKPDLGLISIMTPILLLSSGPVHWAELGIRKGQRWRLRLGLLATTAMGGTFLILQGFEYATKLKEFKPKTDAYGSMFFTITGFHGIHVAIGLLLLIWLQYQAWRGRFGAERHLPVELVSMYWHFVDVVWVFIFASLYLSPHLFG
jgi:heme/copper-type cytochrome/quinol oxidase subunit 3